MDHVFPYLHQNVPYSPLTGASCVALEHLFYKRNTQNQPVRGGNKYVNTPGTIKKFKKLFHSNEPPNP